jgi:ribosomal protein S18 acetylase RimI-like enzyme
VEEGGFTVKESFAKAQIDQFDEVYAVYDACKRDLLERGIFQWGDWGDEYPGREYIRESIMRGELYTIKRDDELVGAVVLNENQSAEWSVLPWTKVDGRVMVGHALVIDPKYQNRGLGGTVVSLCEKIAREERYACVRLDSFTKNDGANKLYLQRGYRMVGTVKFESKPEGNREYYCYEKLL